MTPVVAAMLIAASAVWSLRDWLRHAGSYLGPEAAAGDWVFTGTRFGLAAAAALGAGWLWFKRKAVPMGPAALGGLLSSLLWALVAGTIAGGLAPSETARWAARSGFFSGLLLAELVWLLLHSRSIGDPPSTGTSVAKWLTVNFLCSLILLELLLAAWVRWNPTPLVAPRAVDTWLEAMRRPPHEPYQGERLNSGGFADTEFFVAEEDDFVGVVLSDSFGMAMVPPSFNFVTVAEEYLRSKWPSRSGRIALHNFGVSGIGLPEYIRLYEEEASATNPSLVVLCIFLGNDIHEGGTFGSTRAERYNLIDWLSANALRRAIRLYRMPARDRNVVASVAERSPEAVPPSQLADSSLENPTFSEERFHEIEAARVELARAQSRESELFPALLDGLEYFSALVGKERLLIVLIPDEYHVNDALFAKLMKQKASPEQYDRFSPQARVLAHCETHGIDCLDLTPALRTAENDGRTYHLRDTHWNAHGNRIAGVEMGDAILERSRQLKEKGPESMQ